MDKIREKNGLLLKRMLCILLVTSLLISSQVGINTVAKAASNNTKLTIADFIGNWEASGYALGENDYTEYLAMRVEEDGSFSIYDQQASNPGIAGNMTVVDNDTIKLECESDDFDSPWPELQLTDELEYHFYNANQVRITYKDKSIVFSKQGKRFEIKNMFTGNWKNDHYKEWYTNNGINVSATYKLKLEGDSILMYRIINGKETFITSFCGLNYNKNTKVVKTITELSSASKLPKNWRNMKEGRHFQNFKFRYSSKKHCLKLTFNNKSYYFYSNITYGSK